MNTYIVYYRSYTNEGARIADESIVIEAINSNEACKRASQKLDCRHSIQFASLIKGIDNNSVR